ncbi:hypothetical protein F5148DRAFT_1017662 [Russula earlei]|uniref:Uncharacterized protein n=1 Tax=Russula earlei TaxID=71964 RepID=A0ACC0U0V8_9AGAM|nr:hypothetical protein F5148DRAFT_1017662 [Russula earlei]
MANPPTQIHLPPFLAPLFSYISSCLPPPVHNALLVLLTHGLAFFGALIGLGAALISSKPSDWDAQKVIPPLITLLAAYLALASAVRTATWFVRTATWLVKWGIVAAATSVALAWLLGTGDGGSGVVPSLIAMVSDVLSGRGQDAAANASGGGSQRARSRPQAWDSFDKHWEWQFEEQQWNAADSTSAATQVQQFVANALDAASGSWLSLARGALQGYSSREQTGQHEGESHERRQAQQNDRTNHVR